MRMSRISIVVVVFGHGAQLGRARLDHAIDRRLLLSQLTQVCNARTAVHVTDVSHGVVNRTCTCHRMAPWHGNSYSK